MFEPREIALEDRLNRKQCWVVVVMNLLLLAELSLSMYWGQQDPENLSAVFLRIFVPSAAMTVVAARLMLRRFRNSAAS